MTHPLPTYLTTKEMADLLRVKERKVYDLAAAGSVPHSRATGKLLFPREAVLAWIENAGGGEAAHEERPNVVLGSHDPLLEWALRESGSGLASFFDGSFDGLERFADLEGIATGLHIPEDAGEGGGAGEAWNVATIAERFAYRPVVLVEWAWRERGLIVAPGNPLGIGGVGDLARARLVQRQAKAGSQKLLETLMDAAGIDPAAGPQSGVTARDERDAALAVLDGRGDAALGLAAVAHQFKLDFVPVCRERYDLLVWRKAWFDPPMQRLMEFCRTPEFAGMAQSLGGYDVSGLGRVRFNAA